MIELIKKSIYDYEKVDGPIATDENNYPFSTMKKSREKLDISKYDFLEEEFFIHGYANVYDGDDDNLQVVEKGLKYCNRILVRRPKKNFSGRVYIDIMNATNGYDIEDLWRRAYDFILENNHAYIGITSKPINVQSLKYFNPKRYRDLNWSNGKVVNMPAVANEFANIPGTEEGLVWDIISQVGGICRENSELILGNLKPTDLYLSGQSQSGVYLNTYVNHFDRYLYDKNSKPLFDGYLSLVSAGYHRCLKQNEKIMMGIADSFETDIKVPFITLNTEGDYGIFAAFGGGVIRSKNENTDANKRRYYEVAAAPHTNAASPVLPINEEIVKTKCPPRVLDKDYTYRLNDFPLEYYITALMDKLHIWATEGIAPEIIEPMKLDEQNNILRDEYFNALGGIRSPFVEVPKARYFGNAAVGDVNGTIEFFSSDKMNEIYGNFDNYLEKFKREALKNLEAGLVSKANYDKMLEWAKNVNN